MRNLCLKLFPDKNTDKTISASNSQHSSSSSPHSQLAKPTPPATAAASSASITISRSSSGGTASVTTAQSTTTAMVAQEINLHDVWASNLESEFAKLRDLIDDYRFVAMDTEFPGVIATPVGQFRSKEDFNYQQLRLNVDCLKLIQVGFTLMNEKGQLPPGRDIFQFNLHFDPNTDSFAHESLELLKQAGFDFAKHQSEGIQMEDFGELLTTSGLLVDSRITWLTFHSCFDFGYLIRAIMLGKLPEDEKDFFRFHRKLFPNSFDIKMLLRQPGPCAAMLKGGLQEIADQLHVPRIGQRHQAGSDSLLTAMTFFKLQELFFADNWKEVASAVQGHMFGLSNGNPGTLPPSIINTMTNNGLGLVVPSTYQPPTPGQQQQQQATAAST